MARLLRLVVPGQPHHVTQRGNRRAPVFFEEGDYRLYKDLLSEAAHRAEDWGWSSVGAHFSGKDDGLVTVAPVLQQFGEFAAFLGQYTDDEMAFSALRRSETTGGPVGGEAWVESLEILTGRALRPQKRGPKVES